MDRVDACGASDEGSNPSEGTRIKIIIDNNLPIT